MDNIELFFFFFLAYWWVLCLFYKFTELNKKTCSLKDWSTKQYKWIELMFDCQFCMESHIGMILAIPLAYYLGWYFIFFGWMAASLSNIIKVIKPKI